MKLDEGMDVHRAPWRAVAVTFLGCVLVIAAAVACLSAITGCATGLPFTQKSDAAADAVAASWKQVMADGTVTPEEWAAHKELIALYQAAVKEDLAAAKENAKKTDWGSVLLAVGSSLLLGVPAAVKTTMVLRNKREEEMWGTPEAPKPTGPPAA